MAGNAFALAFTPTALTAAFSAIVNAFAQWPMPRMQNRPICAIQPKWVEVAQENPESFALSFQFDHDGWLHFYLNKETAQRLIDTLNAVVHSESTAPQGGSVRH
jgi:hypothetical protein